MKSPTKPQRKAVRFNLFFLEMIIVLMFFSIAAAVILRSFAASDDLARSSRRLENMAFCAQSAAEIYSETGSISDIAETLFGKGDLQILSIDLQEGSLGELTVPMTSGCEYSEHDPELFMKMAESTEEYAGGSLKTLNISFEDEDGEVLYNITAGAYIRSEDGDSDE
ncbi:MAG: type II secretion system GspH family protein [Oscillospiraceae bacterium]|nr:type II secretion system GspH family protein [Oscillospiraceae bacterium]